MRKNLEKCVPIAVFLLFTGCASCGAADEAEGPVITVMSFNIQVFGQSKASKPVVVDALAAAMKSADIIAIQEVRSVTEAPVLTLASSLALAAPEKDWQYALGPREGRTSSKEQYLLFYDAKKTSLIYTGLYPDYDDIFEREPFAAFFTTNVTQSSIQLENPVENGAFSQSAGVFDFIVIVNHIKPADAAAEIAALPDVVSYFTELWGETDAVILGDFNADGNYYDESLLTSVFPHSRYTLVIGNDIDTTVAANAYTYDRLIITKSAREDWTGIYGVTRFDAMFDFEALGIEPKHISDHYPVWASFYILRDTD